MLLFKALEVRSEYRRKRDILESVLDGGTGSGLRRSEGQSVPTDAFKQSRDDFEEELSALKQKEAKLNRTIQRANLENRVDVNGDTITLNEALERRKELDQTIKDLKNKLHEARNKKVLHKDSRDVEIEPDHNFNDTYEKLQEAIVEYRVLRETIHEANHNIEIDWEYEG